MRDSTGTTLSTISCRSSKEEGKADSSKPISKHQEDLRPRPSNAAAWAWHQHLGGATGGGDTGIVHSAPAHGKIRRASRFKEEAMRMSCSGDNVVFKADSVTVGGSSLFDSYELVSVAKQLEEALTNSLTENDSPCSPTPNFQSKSSGRRTRMVPATLLCSSMGMVDTKDKMEHKNEYEANIGFENGRRKHLPFGKLRRFSFSF